MNDYTFDYIIPVDPAVFAWKAMYLRRILSCTLLLSAQSLLKDKKIWFPMCWCWGKNRNFEILFATLHEELLCFYLAPFILFQILKMQLYFWNTQLDLSTGIRLGLNCRKRILGLGYGVRTSVCLICLCDVLRWSQCTPASSNACSLHRTSLTAWQLADSQRTKPRFSYVNLSLRRIHFFPPHPAEISWNCLRNYRFHQL